MNETPTFRQKLLILATIIIGGCVVQSEATKTPLSIADDITHDTAAKMDWLTIVGGVTIAFGVAGYLAGNTAAASIIAAGATLTAIGLLITAYLSFIAQYRTEFTLALVALGILCFFIFARGLLDRDKNGKIELSDLKSLFFKTKKKT